MALKGLGFGGNIGGKFGANLSLPWAADQPKQPYRPAPSTLLGFNPPRVRLLCVETGEFRGCLFNPEQIEEAYTMNYNDADVIGLDHQVEHYVNTASADVPFTLMFDRAMAVSKHKWPETADLLHERDGIADWRRFLLQFTAPFEDPEGGIADPPQMQLIWPNVLNIRATVRSMRFVFKRFSVFDLRIMAFACEVTLKEKRIEFWSSQRLREHGGDRAADDFAQISDLAIGAQIVIE